LGKTTLGWMFRFSVILGLLALLMVFITVPKSAEFYISLITVGINLLVAIVSGVLLIRKRRSENGQN